MTFFLKIYPDDPTPKFQELEIGSTSTRQFLSYFFEVGNFQENWFISQSAEQQGS